MKKIELPMYRDDGTRVQLAELLSVIPENNWVWYLVEFDGVGVMPEQIPLAEFQAKIRASSNGLAMSFQEAKKFAESIEYAIDCLMVAVKTKNIVDIYRLLADDFSFCEVVLRAIDSTDWMLGASDEAALQSLVLIAS